MVELEKRYAHQGLEILGFPCNQFLYQEPGNNEQIVAFARKFGAKFTIFSKIKVNGKQATDLYKYLRLNSNLDGSKIGWNFGKFLVQRDGVIFKYYGPRTNPFEIEPDIQRLL